MNLGLDMSLKLQQKLSFQMIQSLKLLQVNTLQLEQLLKTELEMNPVLETTEEQEPELETEDEKLEEKEEEEKESEEEEDLDVSEDSIDWEEYLEEGFEMSPRVSEEERSDEDRYEPQPVYRASLAEHLENQLSEKKISERLRLLVRYLINSLEADGYLRVPMDQVVEHTKADVYEIEEALNVIWGMDPAGVGARSLQECLLLQLRRRGWSNTLAGRVVSQTWELFEKMKIHEIAKRLGVELAQVQEALNVIKTLNPKPGYSVSEENPSTIIPDLIVEKVDGEFLVMLNDRSVPQLHINRNYAKMIRRGSTVRTEVKKYVREKLNGAAWLIRSIEQRRTTMLKVMYAIIEKQQDFFEKGPPNLNPLKLQDVADMISMHISTVSRVTSNKYVQTIHGIYELKYFFTEALGQDSDGSDISVEKIKNRIRELVEEENSTRPLSDQRISDILSREGLKVARRTVAKYREQLKILPARLRQKYV